MSTNRKMTSVLIAVVVIVGIAGYLVGHRPDPVAGPGPRPGATGTAATGTVARAIGTTPDSPASATPGAKPTGNTPSALCGAAPNTVTVPTPIVQLRFATATWRSCTTEVMENGVGKGGAAYTVKTTIPFFWSENKAVDALNTAVKKRIDDTAAEFRAGADEATAADQTGGAPFTLSEEPRINQVGRLAVIQLTGEEYVGGAHGGVIDTWLDIDTTTWTILTPDRILLPGADRSAAATRLATLLAPKIKTLNGATCTTDAATLLAGGQMPEGTPPPGGFEKKMELGLQDGGELVIDFPPYYLWAYSCGVGSATLALDDLAGLINPDVVALATAQVPPEVMPTYPG